MPWDQVWPWYGYLKSILSCGYLRTPKNKQMSTQPLGYGANAYFTFIEYIILLCVILLLVNLPLFHIFKDHSVYTTEKPMAAMTLGNFGGANTICEQIPHHLSTKDLRL